MSTDYLDSNPLIALLQLVLLSLSFLVGVAFEGAIIYVFYFLLTLPLRRNERTQLFLDLLGLGLRRPDSGKRNHGRRFE